MLLKRLNNLDQGLLVLAAALLFSSLLLPAPASGQKELGRAANERAGKELVSFGAAEALRRNGLIKQPSLSDLLTRVQLALWAGDTIQARAAISKITARGNAQQQALGEILNSYAVDLMNNQWDHAKIFLEQFPEAEPDEEICHSFIAHWSGTHPDKQLQKQINAWILARSLKNHGYWAAERSWFKKMLAQLDDSAAAPVRIAAATARVKQNPSDFACFDAYLKLRQELDFQQESNESLEYYVPQNEPRRVSTISEASLEWLSGALHPSSAFAAYRVGHRLGTTWPHIALSFLKTSLNMKFSEQDEKQADPLW